MELLKRVWKYYDKKNLARFGFSAAVLFIGPVISLCFNQYPILFYAGLVATIVFTIIFLLLSFKYVDSIHRYFEMMKIDEQSCLKISSFLFAMSKAKEYNTSFKLKELSVRYDIKEAEELSTPTKETKKYYPFAITYTVKGEATSSFSEYTFHLLQHPNNEKNKYTKVEVGIRGTDGSTIWDTLEKTKCIGNQVWQYKFCTKSMDAGQPVDYLIRVNFEKYAGISELDNNRISRLLIYPKNYSKQFDSSASLSSLEIFVPEEFVRDVSRPVIRVYLEGKNPNPAGREERLDEDVNVFKLHKSIALKGDIFFAVEFFKRRNPK